MRTLRHCTVVENRWTHCATTNYKHPNPLHWWVNRFRAFSLHRSAELFRIKEHETVMSMSCCFSASSREYFAWHSKEISRRKRQCSHCSERTAQVRFITVDWYWYINDKGYCWSCNGHGHTDDCMIFIWNETRKDDFFRLQYRNRIRLNIFSLCLNT